MSVTVNSTLVEPLELDVTKAAAAMHAAIEALGEGYVYPMAGDGCAYAATSISTLDVTEPDGSVVRAPAPSCAVGHIIFRVAEHHDRGSLWHALAYDSSYNQEAVMTVIGDGLVDVTDQRLAEALAFLQQAQDAGWPWGPSASVLFALEAIEAGDESAAERRVAWAPEDKPSFGILDLALTEHQPDEYPYPVTAREILDLTVSWAVGRAASFQL